MASGVEEAQVMRMDNVPRTESHDGVVCLCCVLDGRAGGEAAGDAVVGLDVVLLEKEGGFGRGAEGAGWADEFLGFFGDEAADCVSEEELLLWFWFWLGEGGLVAGF